MHFGGVAFTTVVLTSSGRTLTGLGESTSTSMKWVSQTEGKTWRAFLLRAEDLFLSSHSINEPVNQQKPIFTCTHLRLVAEGQTSLFLKEKLGRLGGWEFHCDRIIALLESWQKWVLIFSSLVFQRDRVGERVQMGSVSISVVSSLFLPTAECLHTRWGPTNSPPSEACVPLKQFWIAWLNGCKARLPTGKS